MKRIPNKKVWLLIFVGALLVAAGAVWLLRARPAHPHGPLSIKAFAGTQQTAVVYVRAPQKTTDAAFAMTGAFADMVQVPPQHNVTIQNNTDTSVPVLITVPGNKAEGTYAGTVEVRQDGKTITATPFTVIVKKPTANDIPAALSHPTTDRMITPPDADPMVKDELLVGLQLNLADADTLIKRIASQTHGVIVGASPELRLYQLQYSGASISDLDKKRSDIEWTIGVNFAGYNVQAAATKAMPNDSGYTDPAHPNEYPWDDQFQNQRTWGQRYIGLPEAWGKTTGSKSVRIGSVDSGFDFGHVDLKANIFNADKESLSNIVVASKNPHGTNMAGVMCADGDNNIGVAGVMWHCGLGLYDYFADSWSMDTALASDIARAMQTAAKDNVRVVNISYGWASDKSYCNKQFNDLQRLQIKAANKGVRQAIDWAKTNQKDVLWVMAAGNSCHDVIEVAPAALVRDYPDNVMAVAAIAESKNMHPDNVAALQWASNYGSDISVAAPGEAIYTTTGTLTTQPNTPPYAFTTGTSIAAPFVTGLAGLVLSTHNDLTAKRVKQCIVDAANSTGHAVADQKFRVINAPKAVDCGSEPDPNAPHKDNEQCVFSFATLPEICSSTNPNVEVKFTNVAGSDNCEFESHISWDATSKKVDQTDTLKDLRVGAVVLLANHTFSGAGKHLISHTVTTHTGGPCTILESLYEFTLLPK